MNKFFRHSFLAAAFTSAVVFVSCGDEDPPLPDNTTQFQASTQGINDGQTEATINITLARAIEAAGTINLSYSVTGVTYGDDFTTDPAPDANNNILIPVAVGATSASFKVTKTNTTGLDGDEKVVFTIESLPDGLVLGLQKTFSLSFSEIIATSATMTIDGGGTNANNRVFIDLSGSKQTAVSRTAWDLAFSSAPDKFLVYLNGSNKMFARSIDKNDLTEVTAADTVGFGAQLDFNAIFGALAGEEIPDWVATATSWIDNPDDLNMTAIAKIDVDDDENLVYIVNRGEGPDHEPLGWVKLRVVLDGLNYELQYADIDAADYETVTVAKNPETNMTYVSLTNGQIVNVEPPSDQWDIAWTGLMNEFNFGVVIPYYFQDIIIQNTFGTATAEVLTSEVSYEAFAESDIANLDFVQGKQMNIGSKWRTLPQSGAPSVNSDRFYVIIDSNNNVYKLKFTALVTDGVRGKPQLTFDLVKKGS